MRIKRKESEASLIKVQDETSETPVLHVLFPYIHDSLDSLQL